VPAPLALALLLPFIFVMILQWDSSQRFSFLIYLMIGASVLIFPLLFLPRSLRIHRRKTVTALLSGHTCAHCGYSLKGLPNHDGGFTICPECGVAWRLPERVSKTTRENIRLQMFFSFLATVLVVAWIVWSTVFGEPVFSFLHVILSCELIIGVALNYVRWSNHKKNKPRLVMGSYHELERGHCPACHVLLDGVAMDWDGVTTCEECGAVWRVADSEMEREIFKPTKFGRAYLVPTWVVDEKGKSALKLRVADDWMEFIIASLMKKRCPGCSCSLAGVKENDEGLVVCPECAGLWMLPSSDEVHVYKSCGKG